MGAQAGVFRKYERKPFDSGRCTECGWCLSKCPVMHLPESEAKPVFRALVNHWTDEAPLSRKAERTLNACTSCFACNLLCPEDCRPTNLFLDIWHRRYRREGLPVRARFFLPHSTPNFRTRIIERFPASDRATLESWHSLAPAEEIFYPGCNIITTLYLTQSRLFDGLSIRGGLEYCCGEMYFRMGLYDQVEQIAAKLTHYFRALGVRRVYGLCTACLNVLTNVLPQFGADFAGIEFVSFLKIVHDRLLSGSIPVVKRFDGQAITVQDPCHAKVYEEDYCDWARELLRLLGFTIIEAPLNRDTALCCGIGSGFSHGAAYGKLHLIGGERDCTYNLCAAETDRIGVYCSGCLQTLSTAKYVARNPASIHHVIELVQEAIGETPRREQDKVAAELLKGTLLQQEIGRGRFFIPPIE